MFEPLSRTQIRPAQLITRRKIGRPNRDRAPLSAEAKDDAQSKDADVEIVDVVLYSLGVNGRTTLSRFMPRGQYIDLYA